MDFSISVPTLFIVIIIFLLFRALDKKNRSLEKLKRFSDKTKEDLGVFIREKSVELNDISINIDSQLKKGREILKRILSFEEMLSAKADDFENMKKTVDTYAGTLQELVNMSGRVDENLKRLGEESESVERMGHRLKDVGGRLVKLENELKNTEHKFVEQARSELTEIEGKLLGIHEQKVNDIFSGIDRIEDRAVELENYLKRLESKKQETVRQTESAIHQAVKTFEQEVGKKRVAETGSFRSEIDELVKEAGEKKDLMEGRLVTAEARISEIDKEFSAKIDDFKEQFGQVERMFYTHLESAAKRGEDFEDEVFVNLKKSIDEQVRGQEREIERYFSDVSVNLEKRRKEIVDLFGALRSDTNIWHAELKNQMKGQEKEIETQLKNLESYTKISIKDFTAATDKAQRQNEVKVEKFVETLSLRMKQLDEEIKSASDEAERLFQKIDEDSRTVESRVIGSIERRLEEYEEDVHYRFGKLEAANIDIDALEKSLKETMSSTAHKIREEFQALEKELAEERSGERARAEQELRVFRDEIGNIEAGVNDLKEKAYQSVSSRLKLVEDEFFQDIRTQSDTLKSRLDEWHDEFAAAIENGQEWSEAEIEKLGEQYRKQLAKELAALKKAVETDFSSLEIRAGEFERTLEARLKEKESLLGDITENLKGEVETARQKSLAAYKNLESSVRKAMEADFSALEKRVGEFEKQCESVIREKSDLLEAVDENLKNKLETAGEKAFAEIEALEASVKKTMANDLTALEKRAVEFDKKYQALLKEKEELLASLQKDFKNKLESAGVKAFAEIEALETSIRKSMDDDLSTLGGRVAEFEKNVDVRIAEKEKIVAANSEMITHEVEAVRAKAETQIKSLDDSIGKMIRKSSDVQKNFIASFESKRRELETNLADIEKRIKGFTAQTKVFERADSLKLGLEADISRMKKDVAKIDTYKKEIDEVAKDFFMTKKLVEDVAGRMRDFLTEKKRIDVIEANFSRLVDLSRSIDEKLENVTGQHDLLQELELKFRELESIENEVEGRYQRLENKNKIVETTTRSVDKNFEQLTDLEKNLKVFERELKSLPKLVGELKKEVEYINTSKEKTDKVVGKIDKLDDHLADIEARMEKLAVARDWLARTETRLEKVGKQAEDQLKLLETLVKDDVSRFKKERGAPPMDKRQTVTKLARQGWSPEEIARATKLSRGEVELILELISDKVGR